MGYRGGGDFAGGRRVLGVHRASAECDGAGGRCVYAAASDSSDCNLGDFARGVVRDFGQRGSDEHLDATGCEFWR